MYRYAKVILDEDLKEKVVDFSEGQRYYTTPNLLDDNQVKKNPRNHRPILRLVEVEDITIDESKEKRSAPIETISSNRDVVIITFQAVPLTDEEKLEKMASKKARADAAAMPPLPKQLQALWAIVIEHDRVLTNLLKKFEEDHPELVGLPDYTYTVPTDIENIKDSIDSVLKGLEG